jgi:hypothetical protein
MKSRGSHSIASALMCVVAAALAACADDTPLTPEAEPTVAAQMAVGPGDQREFATMRRVTARYHDLEVAKKEGFVFLHACENRPGEGPVGIVYVNLTRLMDGVVEADSPDALIYAPRGNNRPKLMGVEFAIPYALWPHQEAPKFLGNTFQSEDEFGVYGLHAWVWSENPNGMFAESNPNVICPAE